MNEYLLECYHYKRLFSKFMVLTFSDGTVIYKDSEVREKKYDTGGLRLKVGCTLTEVECASRTLVGVGVTHTEGGQEALHADVLMPCPQSGDMNVDLVIGFQSPDGWLGSEVLFDMLTGLEVFDILRMKVGRDDYSVMPLVLWTGRITLIGQAEGTHFGLFIDGNKVLSCEADGEKNLHWTMTVSADHELNVDQNIKSVDEIGIANVTVDISTAYYPLALSEEIEFPLRANGSIRGFGDYLALFSNDTFTLFYKGNIVATRGGNGIMDVSVTDSGQFAIADLSGVRLCDGSRDLLFVGGRSSGVVVQNVDDRIILHRLGGGLLSGYSFSGGTGSQLYSVDCDCDAVTAYGASVLGLSSDKLKIYDYSTGNVVREVDINGGRQEYVGKANGAFVIKSEDSYRLLMPYAEKVLDFSPKSLSGRAVLGNDGKLYTVTSDEVKVLADITADEIAFADSLYYRRGDKLFYRKAVGKSARVCSSRFEDGSFTDVYFSVPQDAPELIIKFDFA